jgi:NitT/TauT family transport system permease protein
MQGRLGSHIEPPETPVNNRRSVIATGFIALLVLLVLYEGYRAVAVLIMLPADIWPRLGIGLAASFLRVVSSLLIALLWTVPLGFAIGTNRKLANFLQPVVQVIAAIPQERYSIAGYR